MASLITPKIEKKLAGYKTRILPKGQRRIINVIAATLQDNLANGNRNPMIAIRLSRRRKKVLMVHHMEIINGSAILCESYDKPLPNTNGRGVCYFETDAAIRVWESPSTSKERK